MTLLLDHRGPRSFDDPVGRLLAALVVARRQDRVVRLRDVEFHPRIRPLAEELGANSIDRLPPAFSNLEFTQLVLIEALSLQIVRSLPKNASSFCAALTRRVLPRDGKKTNASLPRFRCSMVRIVIPRRYSGAVSRAIE